jgi:hypothetical protein
MCYSRSSTLQELWGVSIFLALKHSEYAGRDVVNYVLLPTKEDGTIIWVRDGGKDAGTYGFDDGVTCPPECPSIP